MSLTSELKAELVRQPVKSADEMLAEVSAMLRFAGGIHLVSTRIIVEAELDSPPVAARLRGMLTKLFNVSTSIVVVAGGGLKKTDRYVVRVVQNADHVARYTGLLDAAGRPVRGLPAELVAAALSGSVAAWRGAFLARGSLLEPGRSSAMEITAPGPEAALALAGVARRMGASAKVKEVRGAQRVVVRETDGILTILRRLEAHHTYKLWNERRQRREARGSANRLANFDDANLRRSARAAVAAGARVERAFEILGEEIPEHLIQAGRLRLAHKQASLEELGKMSDPPLTKDAVAGRIRRLLAMADKVAHETGVPDTEAVLTPEMLEED